MGMYTQVNVFMDEMREGKTRLSLERVDDATLEKTFSIAPPREDVRVIKAYIKPSIVTVVRPYGPKLWRLMRLSRRVTDDMRRLTRAVFAPGDKFVESQDIARLSAARHRRHWRT